MRNLLLMICSFCFCMIHFTSNAQTSTFNGWFFSNHEQKLSKKWSFLSDIQIRSADRMKYVQTILLRPGIKYELSEKHSVAGGYGYFGNWEKENGKKSFEKEHRIWEQFNLKMMAGKTKINHRLRLEQRFLEAGEGYDFAQRFRYFIRAQIPFIKTPEFKKGIYMAFQNEIFLNIQNKENVNDRFFDQNRLYGGMGYRLSEAVDIEAAYLYRRLIKDEGKKMNNHILQLVITTSL